jgi:hypothetical protein
MSETPEHISIFERNPRKTILGTLIALFISIDLVAAYAARVILGHPFHNRPSEIRYLHDNPNKNYRTESAIYHHDLKPNASSDGAIWGGNNYTIHTDSLGFKSAGVRITPVAGDRPRVLFIGDSFTEGLGYEHPETFVGRIEAAMAEQGVEVFNAGVSSYSPIIYWRKTKYLIEDVGLQFQDLVVFLDISDIEDEARFYRLTDQGTVERLKREPGNAQRDITDKSGLSIKRLLRNNTVFTYALVKATRDAFYGSAGSQQLSTGRARARWTVDETLFNAYGREGLARAAGNMTRLHELLSTHGVRLTIAVYPWPDQIISSDLNSIQVSFWKKWAEATGVRFLNYFPCFIREDGGDSVLEEYFIPGDVHWNERGHELVAENFLQWFTEPGAGSEGCCCE